MLLSQSPLRAAIIFSIAAFTSLILFTATTAQARSTAIAYTAELQAPVEAVQEIIKGAVIRCDGTQCIGGQSSSSPRTICAKIADEFGRSPALPIRARRLTQKPSRDATTDLISP